MINKIIEILKKIFKMENKINKIKQAIKNLNNSQKNPKEKSKHTNDLYSLILEIDTLADDKDLLNKLRQLTNNKKSIKIDTGAVSVHIFENKIAVLSKENGGTNSNLVSTINPKPSSMPENYGPLDNGKGGKKTTQKQVKKIESNDTDSLSNNMLKNIDSELAYISNILKQYKGVSPKEVEVITNKIHSLEKSLSKISDDISNFSVSTEGDFHDLEKKLPKNYLKSEYFREELDSKFTIFKDLDENTETIQNLNSIPNKVKELVEKNNEINNKIDAISKSVGNNIPSNIPKEEKAILELSKFMQDGIKQFENISKLYVSKQHELEKIDKLKDEQETLVKEAEKSYFASGESFGKIKTAKEILKKFPSDFNNIKSIFGDIVSEEFHEERIELTDENIKESMPKIEGEVEIGIYKSNKPAILIDGEVLQKAELIKVENNK